MMTNKNCNYYQTKFITSAPDIRYLPNDYGIEIAFIGRSNVGKSSALNALTQQKKLAYTSKKPGRTQLINLFEIADGIKLVDLPGYGYAKVLGSIKQKWQQTLSEYLQKRKCLKGLIILMDIRHSLKNMDIKIIEWSVWMNIPIFVLLTKADKISYNKQKYEVIEVRNRLKGLSNSIEVQIFSSLKNIGVDKLQLKLEEWIKNKNFKHR